MIASSPVFALEITYRDAPSESEESEVVATPVLAVYASAILAASSNEGIDIAEGDLHFFGVDGSPLKAVFSEPPYVDTKRLKYFAGRYLLRSAHGDSLAATILKLCPTTAQVIVRMATSIEVAQSYGWSSVEEMSSKVAQALEIAIPDMKMLVAFETPTDGGTMPENKHGET